jgi:hypothetical protein
MPYFRAIVEIDLLAEKEEDVDDMIHEAVDAGGELPTECTVFTRDVKEIERPTWAADTVRPESEGVRPGEPGNDLAADMSIRSEEEDDEGGHATP